MDIRDDEVLAEFLKYDEDLPLQAQEKEVPLDSAEYRHGSKQYHIMYNSVHDQRVPALLSIPANEEPPFRVLLMLHGVLGHKSSHNQIKRSVFLTNCGYAVMRIDGQYRGEREVSIGQGSGVQTAYHYRNRDAMIQSVVDLMRAVDYLASRDDIDTERIGFIGTSMGGAIGAMFCAHEQRVKAAVLTITGGNFDKLNINAGDTGDQEEIRQAYRLVDPVLYVYRISPRPLLMINGVHDEVVPRAATEALFDAAAEPKRIVWYDCGHANLPDEYLEEVKRFFDTEL
jgi:cephalosporin-C deacetylase-like acetyl esterase